MHIAKTWKWAPLNIEWEERSLVVVISISMLYNVNVHKMFTGQWLLVSRINWHSTLSATGTSSDFKANAWILEDTVHSHQCTVDMVEVQLLVKSEYWLKIPTKYYWALIYTKLIGNCCVAQRHSSLQCSLVVVVVVVVVVEVVAANFEVSLHRD